MMDEVEKLPLDSKIFNFVIIEFLIKENFLRSLYDRHFMVQNVVPLRDYIIDGWIWPNSGY